MKYLFGAIWLALGLTVSVFFRFISSQISKRFVSIGWKIPILFAYSIVIPVAGAALLGHQTLRDRRDTMVSEVHQKALAELSDLDSDFIHVKSRELSLFKNFGREIMRTADLSTISSLTKTMQQKKEAGFVEIRDKYGRLLQTTWNADEKVRLSIVMNTISKICLKRFHPNPPAEKGALDLTLGETFTQSFFLSPMVGWPKILERPDELHTLKFAGREILLYWAILPSSLNQAAFVQIQQNVSVLKTKYLRGRIEESKDARKEDYAFFAWNEQTRELVPRVQVFEADFKKFLDRLRSSEVPLFEEIQMGVSGFLASGFPGRHLKGHSLVALYPVSKIDLDLRNFSILFFLGTLGACFLAMLLGLMLSDFFLRPIQELSAGVHALRERDVSKRVNIPSNDELGALAFTFNQTLDGLKEMLLAHEVQEQLIPKSLPKMPGYRIALMSHPARDLGGDYCDVQSLSNDRIFLTIGDATGHGVSSALVMTMAKAGVLDFILRENSLTDLLKRLNLLFFTYFQRKVNMTFFAAVLDLFSGTLRFSNAGHPFPIMVDKDGNVSRLKLSHPPLGFSQRDDRFQEATVSVAPGTLVLFFTDIMMEICDRKGIPWGPKNLIEFVRERRTRNPEEIKDDLFRFAKEYSGSDSFEDDFTLLILKRE
ncbi:SpoIIE family protein phosphatase [bacterium]|nr:SpoIIE family protein phosphatase [bacterium]